MPRSFVIALFGALFFSLMVFSTAASATHLGQTKTVGGVAIYLGIVPAAAMRQNPDIYPAHELSKIPTNKHPHHVMLALFDGPGGKRITDAIITAWVSPLALAGSTKTLDPTVVAGALTYCNYFRISPSDTTVIQVKIRRPDAARMIQARFVIEPHAE
jgi:hypothetical protein